MCTNNKGKSIYNLNFSEIPGGGIKKEHSFSFILACIFQLIGLLNCEALKPNLG